MEPKLAPKSIKNWFQEVLNKKVEKWSQKSHAVLCGCARGCASQGLGGPLNQLIQRVQRGNREALDHTPRAQGGTVADF